MADVDISPKPPSIVFINDGEDVDAIFARFPGPVSISPSRFAWSDRTRLIGRLGCGLVVLVLSVLCVVAVINAIFIGSWGRGLLASAGLGFCLLVFLAISLRAGRPVFLVLDQDGFAVRNGRTYQSCRWADVRDFRLGGIVRWPRIRFKNSSPSARRRVLLGLGEDWLIFLIPYRDKALATLMNQWRERALAAAGANGPKREIARQ